MYKLRVYKPNGDLAREEFFPTLEKMNKRYDELFVYLNFGLNPTAWVYNNSNNRYERLLGY